MNKHLLAFVFCIFYLAVGKSAIHFSNENSDKMVVIKLSNSNTLSPIDTIKEEDNYSGYRLFISDIGVYQLKPNWMRIQYRATNTGSKMIETNKRNPLSPIHFRFDPSLAANQLKEYEKQIGKALQLQKISLQPGEQSEIKYLKFFTNAKTYGMEEKVQEIAEVLPIVEKKTEQSPNPIPKPEKGEIEKNERTKGGKPQNEASSKLQTDISTEDLLREKKYCPDLIIEEVKIVEQSKKWLTLEFSVRNQGKGIAHLFGTARHERDNLAILAYMSGSPKLSRGAISLGGTYITKGKGMLHPNESFTGTIKLDIRTKTRYTPVVILSLDAYQTAKECDRTNNTLGILVE